ncbi:hypothetical protein COV06_02055 [Candidatus Uhrbacteria bacterium CG10_big_fil_rev_8_21_14_0_10_50_16]|uniref:Uncharacterized protein n=1 Tax=Candidatus Uhrbacteria bacterium CG10_big_fil_rev_8_21_14_0_10_50_16 TaxID=1975039 RepID=A0A2H0RPR9_9BACT|nr:MAG: hypothetical protein COV06_02055 [Candidatus Uhrbacteria bacterium CG10_big_fil_rev_8_21_14_0_10_50_16]
MPIRLRLADNEEVSEEMPTGLSFGDIRTLGLLEVAEIGTRLALPSGIEVVRTESGLGFITKTAPVSTAAPAPKAEVVQTARPAAKEPRVTAQVADIFGGSVAVPSGRLAVDASVPVPAPKAEVVQTATAPPAAKIEIKTGSAQVADIVEDEARLEREKKAAAHAANLAARAAIIPGLVVALVALAKEFLKEGGHMAGIFLEEAYVKSGPFATRVVAEGIETIENSVVMDGRAILNALRALNSNHPLRGMVDAMVLHGPHAVHYDRILINRNPKGKVWILPLWAPVASAVTDRLRNELVGVARYTKLKNELRRRLSGGAVVKGGRKIARHPNGGVDWDRLHDKFEGKESLEGRKVAWGHIALIGDWAFCLDATDYDKTTVVAVAAELTDEGRKEEQAKVLQDINWANRSVNGVKLIPFNTRQTPEGAYRVDRILKQDGTCPISGQEIPQQKGGAFHFLVYAPRGGSDPAQLVEEMGYVPLRPWVGYALLEDLSILPTDWEVWQRWEIVTRFSATVSFVADKSIKLEPASPRKSKGSVSLSSRKLKEERSDADARKALGGGKKKKGGGSKKTTRRLRARTPMSVTDRLIESWEHKSPEEFGIMANAMIGGTKKSAGSSNEPAAKKKGKGKKPKPNNEA